MTPGFGCLAAVRTGQVLGLAVQVSAQSWQGLAAREDERYRIAATADGGIWLLRTPHPEPVTGLAGSSPAADTARRVLRVPVWHRDGVSRMRQAPVADPAIVRSLGVGQAAYIYRGGVTFVQVKRLIAAPAAVAGTMAGPGWPPGPMPAVVSQPAGWSQPAGPGAGGEAARLPDAGPLLDEAFGGEQG